MIKKGQTQGAYRGITYEVHRVEDHKDRWYYILNGESSLPDHFGAKRSAVLTVQWAIDKLLGGKADTNVLVLRFDKATNQLISGSFNGNEIDEYNYQLYGETHRVPDHVVKLIDHLNEVN